MSLDLLQNIYYAKNLPKERDFEEKLIIQYQDSKKDKIEIKEEHIIADNLLYIKNLNLQKVEKVSWAGDRIKLEKILDSNTNNFELYAKDTSIESKTLPFSNQALQFIESKLPRMANVYSLVFLS